MNEWFTSQFGAQPAVTVGRPLAPCSFQSAVIGRPTQMSIGEGAGWRLAGSGGVAQSEQGASPKLGWVGYESCTVWTFPTALERAFD
jgi:hypothetical protein